MGVGFLRVGSYYQGKYYGSVKSIDSIKANLKYIGFRSRELNENGDRFFNSKSNMADWRRFLSGIENHKALRHSESVKAHKMIFSLRKRDYEAYLDSGKNYKDIVRKVFRDYERQKGVTLDWIAVAHDQDRDNPHCHVVIRAASEPGIDGTSKRIFFSKEDINFLKDSFNLEVERHRVIEIEQDRYRNNEVEYEGLDFLNDISKSIEQVIKEKQREIEYQKQAENRRKRGR